MLPEKPEWAKDQIRNDVYIFPGWLDRFKIFCGFSIGIDVYTNCENVPGQVEAIADISIRSPLWWPRRKKSSGVAHPPRDDNAG